MVGGGQRELLVAQQVKEQLREEVGVDHEQVVPLRGGKQSSEALRVSFLRELFKETGQQGGALAGKVAEEVQELVPGHWAR